MYCELGKHDESPGKMYVYSDKEHGLLDDTRICAACLLEWVKKHYPGGKLEQHLRQFWNWPKDKVTS